MQGDMSVTVQPCALNAQGVETWQIEKWMDALFQIVSGCVSSGTLFLISKLNDFFFLLMGLNQI